MSKRVGEEMHMLGKRRRDGQDGATQPGAEMRGTSNGKRRTTSPADSSSSSSTPSGGAGAGAALDTESIAKLAQVLTVRLSYASLKVAQGWTLQTISEVENLYSSRFKGQAEERTRVRMQQMHKARRESERLRDSGYSAGSSAVALGEAALDEYDIEGEDDDDEDGQGEQTLAGYSTAQIMADRGAVEQAHQQSMPYRPFGPEAHLAHPYTSSTTTIAFQTPSSSPTREYPDNSHGFLSPPPRPASSLQPHPSPSMYNYVNASPVMGTTRADASSAGRFAGPPPRLGQGEQADGTGFWKASTGDGDGAGAENNMRAGANTTTDERGSAEGDGSVHDRDTVTPRTSSQAAGLLPAAGIGGPSSTTIKLPQHPSSQPTDAGGTITGSTTSGPPPSPATMSIRQGQAFLLNPRHQTSLQKKNPSSNNPLRGEYSVSNVTMDDLDGTFGAAQ